MTNRNLRSSDLGSDLEPDLKSIVRSPFLLKPAAKDYLWGGSRLNDDFSKNIDLSPLAETWECSAHEDGPSLIASGYLAGKTLTEALTEHPEFLGTHPQAIMHGREGANPGNCGGLPILIKLIDAKKDLSVQVHPDDEYAIIHENGSLGKCEMWYVLDAAKDASLVYGFWHDMDRETVKKSIMDGSIEKYLQKIHIKKGDVFFIPPGRVHAIGAGTLIAEIQESSNLTYRLYDYGRVDKDGRPRELHIEKALDVADLKGSASPRQPMRMFCFRNGSSAELLCRCRYFQVERVLLNTERCREMARMHTGSNSFQALLCTDGCGVLYWEKGEMLDFYKGDCIFVPAGSPEIKMHGQACFLKVGC